MLYSTVQSISFSTYVDRRLVKGFLWNELWELDTKLSRNRAGILLLWFYTPYSLLIQLSGFHYYVHKVCGELTCFLCGMCAQRHYLTAGACISHIPPWSLGIQACCVNREGSSYTTFHWLQHSIHMSNRAPLLVASYCGVCVQLEAFC